MSHVLVRSLLGGMLIGGGAALLLLWDGQVAGVSGILDRTLHGAPGKGAWRPVFLLGMVAPLLVPALHPTVVLATPLFVLGIAGLLVGFGTRVASGCTSGHGVCGISSGSLRSLVATLVFMAVAMLTVFAGHRLAGP